MSDELVLATRRFDRAEMTDRPRGLPAVPWVVLGGGVLALFLALPPAGLVARAIAVGSLPQALTRPVVLQSLQLTLATTCFVLVLALLLGSPLALLLARRRFPGKSILETLVDLPMMLPPAVAGLALLLTFGRRGLLGDGLTAFGLEVPFTTAAVVLAQLFVAAPFYVRAARAGFLGVPVEMEQAAMLEGSRWQVFRHVTAPLAAPSLLGGAVMCWARAIGEFGATIMFAGSFPGRTQTMPLAIYAALQSDLDAAIVLSLILLGVSFVLLLAFRRFLERG